MVGFLSSPNAGNSSPVSSLEYTPSYYSSAAEDSEKENKEPEVTVRPIFFLKTRATTLSTLTGSEIKDKYGKAKRFVTRSGANQPEYCVDEVNEERGYIRRRFSGWRGGVLAAVISAGSVLLVNLVFTIGAAVVSGTGFGIGTIYESECEKIHTIGLWTHIVINVLGTVLLGCSNYTMQCLSSPTRKEVDEAHAVGSFLDIGLPSFRNLRGWKKKCLFGLLTLSTLPLHFLWNSAVFITTQRLDYQVFVVTPDFFKHSTVDCTQNVSVYISDATSSSTTVNFYARVPLYVPDLHTNTNTITNYTSVSTQTYSANSNFPLNDVCDTANTLLTNATLGRLQRLSNSECISDYGVGSSLIKKRGNLLAVTKPQEANHNSTVLLNFRSEQFVSNYTGNNWVCNPAMLADNKYKCDYKNLAKTADDSWKLGDFVPDSATNRFKKAEEWTIDYCLSQPTDLGGVCQLQYSLIIMLTVLIANMTKFLVIFYFLYTAHDPVLATIGDGIASFLERPDPFTADRPFLNRRSGRKFKLTNAPASPAFPFLRFMSSYGLPLPVQNRKGVHNGPSSARWKKPKTVRWWSAPSTFRWLTTLILCTLTIGFASFLYFLGCINLADNISPFSIGFGDYSSKAVLRILGTGYGSQITDTDFESNSLLIQMVTLANVPQVIVSCLYFAYNTVYTSMVSADEFSRFTKHRKTLRTTDPVGAQRSTYWLSLPWTYGLPLAAASSMLHWLISQSLFVARTEILGTDGVPEPMSYMQVAYSPMAILVTICFGSAMVLTMVLNGTRKLEQGAVLVANNSLAIAAACQPGVDNGGARNAHLKAVKWGAMRDKREDGLGHCGFSAEEVDIPLVGELYI